MAVDPADIERVNRFRDGERSPTQTAWLHQNGQAYLKLTKKLQPLLTASDQFHVAFTYMIDRMERTNLSIHVLYEKDHKHHFYDIVALLRVMYDLHIQFLYMATDPVRLPSDYVDYRRVDCFNVVTQMEVTTNPHTKIVTSMPEWPTVKADVVAAYDEVKQRFYSKKQQNPTVRTHWYKGNLSDLAMTVGFGQEYKTMNRLLSASVHSSMSGLFRNMVHASTVEHDALFLMIRMVRQMCQHVGVTFEADEREMVDDAMAPMY